MIRTGIAATVLAAAFVLGGPVAANAHSQTVDPPGAVGPTVTGPISRPFAQAHCNAASPGVVWEASNSVVVFTPAAQLPCQPIANPGGQVHP